MHLEAAEWSSREDDHSVSKKERAVCGLLITREARRVT